MDGQIKITFNFIYHHYITYFQLHLSVLGHHLQTSHHQACHQFVNGLECDQGQMFCWNKLVSHFLPSYLIKQLCKYGQDKKKHIYTGCFKFFCRVYVVLSCNYGCIQGELTGEIILKVTKVACKGVREEEGRLGGRIVLLSTDSYS